MTTVDTPSVTWQDVVVSFVPPAKRQGARVWVERLWLPLILLIQTAFTWRLTDVAFDDEALYVNAGRDIISHYLHGTDIASFGYGSYFSGAPNVYPVVAGALDNVGGLELVRFFALLLMLGTTVFVHHTARHLFGTRAALFSALLFALTGSVQELGKFATYDAPCLFLISLATWIAVTRQGVLSALPLGAVLAMATVVKFTGAIFIPFVLVLAIVTYTDRERLRAIARGTLATAIMAWLLAVAYRWWGSGIEAGLKFSTTSRHALSYGSYSALTLDYLRNVVVVLVLAIVAGLLLLRSRSWQRTLIVLVFLGAGVTLSASQIHIHEFTSLEKHTAFETSFLAVPAGFALEKIVQRRFRYKAVAGCLVWLVLIQGLWRSNLLYSWPSSISKVISTVEKHPVAGQYLTFDSDTERFYTRDHYPQIFWANANLPFEQGTAAVLADLRKNEWEGVVYQTTPGMNALETATLHSVEQYLSTDRDYRLIGEFKVFSWDKKDRWYVWQLRS